jgi:periplasmic protein TonB
MSTHLSEKGVSMYLIGDAGMEERRHAEQCAACRAKIAAVATPLSYFRGAVRNWSERASAEDYAAVLRWTVIPPTDHLGRLLLPALDIPWYRSLWSSVRDCFGPQVPPLDITSKPVLVRNIWGQYGRQKKSWVLSVALQSVAVLLLFTFVSSRTVQQKVVQFIPLMDPNLPTYRAEPPKAAANGGGGGGDRSGLPASKGRLPKAALKQFTPPAAVIRNTDPKLAMEPSIIAPPDIQLPAVNMAQYGDPLAQIGIPSNGPGAGGGIGSGVGGGIGPGKGGGFGPGEGGGAGGGVFRVGGGVTAPALLYRVEPEYSEEARKAKYQGIVVLYVEVDPNGRARNVRVLQSLGLGLDEKAIEAVRKWRFRPGYKDGRPVTVAATVEVHFRLL